MASKGVPARVAIAALVVSGLAVPGCGEVLLACAPLIALLGGLLHDRYPGERLLADLIDRRAAHRRRPAIVHLQAFRRAPRLCLPRGGLLLARSLAVRPPPAVLPG